MGIPNDIEDKLDSDSSWAIQHRDIVQTMDEAPKEKPWSRYMIQRHLDGDPAKGTVQDRLDELVELDVLDRYEYTNQTLYDLSYDPIVTDGGRLKDASLIELVTLRDRKGVRDLVTGTIITSFLFFTWGIVASQTQLSTDISMSGNFYFDAAITLYVLAFVLLILIWMAGKLDSLLSSVSD